LTRTGVGQIGRKALRVNWKQVPLMGDARVAETYDCGVEIRKNLLMIPSCLKNGVALETRR